ncbi:MAG: glycerophosphodiester phosphodiesterase [Bacteroidota bacterium]
MLNFSKAIYIFLIAALWQSCSKENNFITPAEYAGTKILIHKGGGGKPYGIYQPNSLDACKEGLKYADGIEIDIQKSRDGTAWLFHDEYFLECGTNNKTRLTEYTDDEINSHIACVGNNYSLTKLEDVFSYYQANHLDKLIHLDIKPWLPSIYSDGLGYLNKLGDEIIRLAEKYDMKKRLIIECEDALLLNQFRNNSSNYQLYLDSFGDFETGMKKAMKANYTGLSCKVKDDNLSKEMIDEMHRNGLKVDVWTIDEDTDINKYISWKADFILTDNIQFVQ